MKKHWISLVSTITLALPILAIAQIPRINTFFPIGGRAGTTVQMEVRGANLDGASQLLVSGKGVKGTVGVSSGKTDEAAKTVWQNKCSTCHELRSPANRSLTEQQWIATIDRMIRVRQAPISQGEQTQIVNFVKDQIKNGKLTATVDIEPGTLPGIYELRIVTNRGISSVGLFEVGNIPEIIAENNTRQTPKKVTLPVILNGTLSENAERHHVRFEAKKGQRIVFNFKGVRYKPESVLFFNPNLRLYDSTGKEIASSHGYFDLDPLIDWTAPADGAYTLEVRDLLGRGNPGSVYRLTIGELPYDTVLYPSAIRMNEEAQLRAIGKNTEPVDPAFTTQAPSKWGVQTISTPFGPHAVYVSRFPIVIDGSGGSTPTTLPATFTGKLETQGATKQYPITGQGPWEFEVYDDVLGSRADVLIALHAEDGKVLVRGSREGRMGATLEAGKTYNLRIKERNDQSGADFIYVVSATPAYPRIELGARPANINLRPGLSVAVELEVLRREGVNGDITIRAEGLPPGVTATTATLFRENQDTYIVLTADANIKPMQVPIRFTASATGTLGKTEVGVKPQEIYVMQNRPIPIDRAEAILSISGQADFSAEFAENKPIKLHPRKVTEVRVKINRKQGFTGNVTARLVNLPNGWICYQETVGNVNEMVLRVRPDGRDTRPFFSREESRVPVMTMLIANSDEFQFAMAQMKCEKDLSPDPPRDQPN